MDTLEFCCPVCHFNGEFVDFRQRKHAQCPQCKCLERHRLQIVILQKIFSRIDTKEMSILHFAPDPFFKKFFVEHFKVYESADIEMKGVDHLVDLQYLPFQDATYDFVFASHVLEHIPDDLAALSEIRRILKPNGIAVLPVPIVSYVTREYDKPDPKEDYHVRAPGVDYYQRYENYFTKIELFTSLDVPAKNQAFVYCKPDLDHPYKHGDNQLFDSVPVCFKG